MKEINKFFEHKCENPKYLAILLHGYGSSGEDLIALAPELAKDAKDTYFISPNAPMDLPHPFMAAYQWFGLENRDPKVMHPQIVEANKSLKIFIDKQLERLGLGYKNLILVGFSQGAMMSLCNALNFKEEIAGVVAFSGRLISPQDLGGKINSKPKICLIHGKQDDVVPFENFIQAKQDLDELDFEFEAHEIENLGHSIDFSAMKKARNFLKKIIK